MSDKIRDLFVKVCNEKGLEEGFKLLVESNCIRDINIYRVAYQVNFQLHTRRKKHENFDEELEDCLKLMGLRYFQGIVYKIDDNISVENGGNENEKDNS